MPAIAADAELKRYHHGRRARARHRRIKRIAAIGEDTCSDTLGGGLARKHTA